MSRGDFRRMSRVGVPCSHFRRSVGTRGLYFVRLRERARPRRPVATRHFVRVVPHFPDHLRYGARSAKECGQAILAAASPDLAKLPNLPTQQKRNDYYP